MIYLQLRGPGGPVKIKCFSSIYFLPAAVFLTISPSFHPLWFIKSIIFLFRVFFFFS